MPYVPVEVDRRKKGPQVKKGWFKFRISKDELEALRAKAQKAGISMADLIRLKVFEE